MNKEQAEEEVQRLHTQLANEYAKSFPDRVSVIGLWARIERLEVAIRQVEVRGND